MYLFNHLTKKERLSWNNQLERMGWKLYCKKTFMPLTTISQVLISVTFAAAEKRLCVCLCEWSSHCLISAQLFSVVCENRALSASFFLWQYSRWQRALRGFLSGFFFFSQLKMQFSASRVFYYYFFFLLKNPVTGSWLVLLVSRMCNSS